MKDKKNQPGFRRTIEMIMAGYPVHKAIFAGIIAKLTGNNELFAELDKQFQSCTDSFTDLKAIQADMGEVSARKNRAMKKLEKKLRKIHKIVKQTMPKETWPEFGIKVEPEKEE